MVIGNYPGNLKNLIYVFKRFIFTNLATTPPLNPACPERAKRVEGPAPELVEGGLPKGVRRLWRT